MPGSTLRRTVLCLVVVALLLPLASAWAAPARERETARIQLPEWSRTLLAPFGSLLNLFHAAAGSGNNNNNNNHAQNGEPTKKNNEGNGFDPHGKP